MSISSGGTTTLSTTLPSIGKHVTRVGSNDGIVYWINSTNLGVRYQDPSDWSSTLSGPTAVPVESQSLIGSPRNLLDLVEGNDRWTVWPHVSGSSLQITMIHLDGDATSVTSANYVYANAFGGGEVVRQMSVTTEGVMMFVQGSDFEYTLRLFTYPTSTFGSTTVDASFSTNPVVANYSTNFGPEAVARFGRDRLYVLSLDGSQVRAHYLDPAVSGDTVTFTTVANTSTGLPSDANDLVWVGSLDAVVATVYANGSGLNLLATDTDASNPVVTTLGISGSVSGTKKLIGLSSSEAYLYLANPSCLAKLSLSTYGILAQDTSFTSNDAASTLFDGTTPVVIGTNLSTSVYGTNASQESSFGARTDMGTTSTTVTRIGSIQSLVLGSTFFVEDQGAGGSQDIYRYTVTSAPPGSAVIPVGSSYVNRRLLKSGLNFGSVQVLPNGLVGVGTFESSVGDYYLYDIEANTLDLVGQASAGFAGDSSVAPNGDLFLTGEGEVFRSEGGTSVPVEVINVGLGGNAGGVHVYPNGMIVWVSGTTPARMGKWVDGTATSLTGVSDKTFSMGISSLSNGNVLVTERDLGIGTFSVVNPEGVGSDVSSFTITSPSSLFDPISLAKYDTDKFFVGTGSGLIWNLDMTTSPPSAVPVNVDGFSIGSNCFAIALAPNGYLYQTSLTGDQLTVAEPAS